MTSTERQTAAVADERRVDLDPELAERLRVVVDALGGSSLPLRVVARALLVEATERLAAELASSSPTIDSEYSTSH